MNAIKILLSVGGKPSVLEGMPGGGLSLGGIDIPFNPNIRPVIAPTLPQQILGLVPLLPCVSTDCRVLEDESIACYMNPVFGSPTSNNGSSYQNDLNSFFLSYQGSGTCQFIIQKQTNVFFNSQPNASWSTVATITDNTYGVYYPLGSVPGQPTYFGFTVNWGLVYAANGGGIYRISVNTCTLTYTKASVTIYEQGATHPIGLPSAVAGGTLKIGSYSCPIGYTSLSATTLTYIAALINASNICTAVVSGTDIVVSGPNNTLITLNGEGFQQITWQLTGGTIPVIGVCTCAYNSPPFLLRNFNCDQAHGTIKFECWKTGVQGDVDNDGNLFQLCNTTFYDSIRARGFFGYTEFGDDVVKVEWGVNNTNPFGQVQTVRDKVVRGYQLKTYYWPQWLLNRIYVYCFTGTNPLLVSDYNRNNSDYYLQQRSVIKDDGLKPEYLDSKQFDPLLRTMNRTGIATIKFKQGIQGLISSIYCQINS